MARIGLKNFLVGELNADGETYGVAIKPGRAISCKVEISFNEAKLYADDVLAESDTSFSGGKVTLTIDDEDIDVMSTLLGHTVEDGVMIRNANDVAPYVGLGRIVTKIVNNVSKYKVEFLCKVKFAEPSNDETTKGENLEFGTTELEGTLASLDDGTWSDAKQFDTIAEAQAYLESKFTAE